MGHADIAQVWDAMREVSTAIRDPNPSGMAVRLRHRQVDARDHVGMLSAQLSRHDAALTRKARILREVALEAEALRDAILASMELPVQSREDMAASAELTRSASVLESTTVTSVQDAVSTVLDEAIPQWRRIRDQQDENIGAAAARQAAAALSGPERSERVSGARVLGQWIRSVAHGKETPSAEARADADLVQALELLLAPGRPG